MPGDYFVGRERYYSGPIDPVPFALSFSVEPILAVGQVQLFSPWPRLLSTRTLSGEPIKYLFPTGRIHSLFVESTPHLVVGITPYLHPFP